MERVWMGKPGIPTQSFLGELSWSGRAYVESSDVLHRICVKKTEIAELGKDTACSSKSGYTTGSLSPSGVTALSDTGE